MQKGKITAIIEKDENGYFAYCPELSRCHTQGDTFDEAFANLKEAVELYLETMAKDNIIFLNKEIFSTSFEVEVA
ncbi:MAG TPA: type II toxin-antitoxin system HicB family antitoxin [Candidatus Kapabacteria bacterium]|nr:type II toxin-antitoxin system HicB family antitoxin [Candidatus Kapabacteria bacterium]